VSEDVNNGHSVREQRFSQNNLASGKEIYRYCSL